MSKTCLLRSGFANGTTESKCAKYILPTEYPVSLRNCPFNRTRVVFRMRPAPARLESLRTLVRSFPSVLLGYSGGVDSAFLAVVLRQELGRGRMLAAIGRSPSYPEAQWRAAHD